MTFRETFEKQLKEKILQKCGEKTTEEAFLIKAFKYFDIYNSGELNYRTFTQAMEKIGLYYSPEDLQPLFLVYDSNGNGTIDYKEFSVILFGSGSKGYQAKPSQEEINQKQVTGNQRVDKYLSIFRTKIAQRGARGIIGLQRSFKIIDDDNSKDLNLQEFTKACKDFKMEFTSDEVLLLFQAFDRDHNGAVDYNEFLRVVRGELNEFRRNLVIRAFKVLDLDQSGVVDYDDIKHTYNADKHPLVMSGVKTTQQVLGEFLETFESQLNDTRGTKNDQNITIDEWVEYYSNISASIDADLYFETMMNSSWNLEADSYKDHGKGWAREDNGVYERNDSHPVTSKVTQRIGMESAQNPFATTDKYYQQHQTVRTSLGNIKNFQDPDRDFNQITGEESKSNPLTNKIGPTYDTHKVSTQDKIQKDQSPGKMAQGRSNEILIEKFRELLFKRGAKGIVGLKRQFTLMDQDNSGALDMNEFQNAIQDYRLQVNEDEITRLFHLFDFDGNNCIDFSEFINVIVGSMSDFRLGLIVKVFKKLDTNGNGVLDIDEIKAQFDPTRHPSVTNGTKTEDEVLTDFMDLFESNHNVANKFQASKSVTWEEFVQFYTTISSTISKDKDFDILITCVWSIDLQSHVDPVAGVKHQQDFKDSRAAFKYDMHRSLFGQYDNSPYKDQIQTSQKQEEVSSTGPQQAAGMGAWNDVKRKGLQSEVSCLQQPEYNQNKDGNSSQLMQIYRERLRSRGARGLIGLRRTFKIIDEDGSNTLSPEEFMKAMSDYRIPCEENEARALFEMFDSNGDGKLQFDEFLRSVKGELSERREAILLKAFRKHDKQQSGEINMEDLKDIFNASHHPEVKQGKKTEDQVLYEFLDTFEMYFNQLEKGRKDRTITFDEFIEYYTNVSIGIDDDDYFDLMVCNVWNVV